MLLKVNEFTTNLFPYSELVKYAKETDPTPNSPIVTAQCNQFVIYSMPHCIAGIAGIALATAATAINTDC